MNYLDVCVKGGPRLEQRFCECPTGSRGSRITDTKVKRDTWYKKMLCLSVVSFCLKVYAKITLPVISNNKMFL